MVRHYLTMPVSRICILSRDEWKQAQMAQEYPDDRLRWFLGDVRDLPRLTEAFHGVDMVIHAAALKRVDAVAYNPSEVIATNVLGTQNVIRAAIAARVGRVLLISSDKAVEPTNIYGASKMCAEWLAVASNVYAYPQGTRVSVVRYGNVIGSRGSVVELWRALGVGGGSIPITDKRCTRFWITMEQAVQLIQDALKLMDGGEIFVPDLPSMRIVDLAEAIAPGAEQREIGLRPGGEKLHEKLLNQEEVARTVWVNGLYVVRPALNYWGGTPRHGDAVRPDWEYVSDRNGRWVTVEEMREMLKWRA